MVVVYGVVMADETQRSEYESPNVEWRCCCYNFHYTCYKTKRTPNMWSSAQLWSARSKEMWRFSQTNRAWRKNQKYSRCKLVHQCQRHWVGWKIGRKLHRISTNLRNLHINNVRIARCFIVLDGKEVARFHKITRSCNMQEGDNWKFSARWSATSAQIL